MTQITLPGIAKTKMTVDENAPVNVPHPNGTGQARITLADCQRHPQQPRQETGSEAVDDQLIRSYLPDTIGTDDEGLAIHRPGGQDIRHPLPVVCHWEGKYTMVVGHRRRLLVKWYQDNLPILAGRMFPDGSMLCTVLQADPLSPDVLRRLDDHTTKETRRPLLIVEQIQRIDAVTASMADLPDRLRRAELSARFGQAYLEMSRKVRCLPPVIWQAMVQGMRRGVDSYSWSQLQDLYNRAQEYAREKQKAKTGIDVSGRSVNAPDPNDPGPSFNAQLEALKTGAAVDKRAMLSRKKLEKAVADMDAAQMNLGHVRPIIAAIIAGSVSDLTTACKALSDDLALAALDAPEPVAEPEPVAGLEPLPQPTRPIVAPAPEPVTPEPAPPAGKAKAKK